MILKDMRNAALLALAGMLLSLFSPFAVTLPAQSDGPPAIVTLDLCHQGQPGLSGGSGMAAHCPGNFVLPEPSFNPEPIVLTERSFTSLTFPPEPAPPRA